MGGSINWTYSSALLQMKVPDRFLGRVFALDFAFFTLAMSLSVWFSGWVLDTYSLDPQQLVLIFAGASVLPLFIWGSFALGWGREDRIEAIQGGSLD
jgi:Na+/melibiose symporter-like transporter